MKNYNILKTYCSTIFLIGSGNFWFEDKIIGDDKRLYYRVCSFLLYFSYCVMTVLEIVAILKGEFPEDEKRDCVTFAVSHTIVLIKMFSVLANKEKIKDLNRRMIEVCKAHEEDVLMTDKYRIMKINVIAYFAIVYGSAMCFVFEGLRKLNEGSHFVTIVTYYPAYEDNSIPATIFRIVTTLMLFIMMMTMIVSVDSFTMVYLIMYKYKFITLRHFFEKTSEECDRLNKIGKKEEAAEKLSQRLIDGIIMHNDILMLCNDIDGAFGLVVALQVCLSSGAAVTLLLQIAIYFNNGFHVIIQILEQLSDKLTFVAGMKIVFYVMALFFLLGLFLCNAGEITYQASLLSDAIFYCGWHTCPPYVNGRNIRKIVHLAIMRAQRPLVMKAFKMLELTYATFIQVVRSTYSVFALLYAQN